MPEVPAVPDAGSLSERVGLAFESGGRLAASLDGFEPRQGQRQLADLVARTFEEGGTLVAEAGTGTGKTLAYLVPAVLARRRVLVSTGTRPLQDQVFYKDLPSVTRALGVTPRVAYMKGRTNYLCLHRFRRLEEASAALAPAERQWMAHIAEWAGATTTGDRSEIDELPDEFPLWSELSATSDQCLGRECPEHAACFVTRMREEAAAADIVIVNHHLLCADASVRQGHFGEVIPDCDLAVIDEAHQLEDVVTQYFGVSLTSARVDEFARDAARAVAAVPATAGAFAVSIAQTVTDVQQAARHLFDALRVELMGGGTGRDRVLLTPEAAGHLHDVTRALTDALGRVIRAIAAEHTDQADLAAIQARAEAMRNDLAILTTPDDQRYVHVVEVRGRSVWLRAAPIDVSAIVRDVVLAGRTATVLTSATLAVDGSFDYTLGRLGLPDARTAQVASEFDYRTQTVLYLPPEMPDPRSREFNQAAASEIVSLLECTRGRAFVLFTSYAAMRDVQARLAGRIEWPLLVQGSASRSALLREFRATANAVLLATASFWQGVDVAGEALSCVIVDRLPFVSPADPLVAARIAAIEARGGQPFHEYQVPLATLTLLQGLGRLIRTRTDRGVLAVLDPRLQRFSYGRRFLASMPPAPITDSLETVARFFA